MAALVRHSDVTTVEEAFAAVDGQEVNQHELWDASNRRAYTVYEVGAGDNSFGMIFAQGTTDTVVTINDGGLRRLPNLLGGRAAPLCVGRGLCGGIALHGCCGHDSSRAMHRWFQGRSPRDRQRLQRGEPLPSRLFTLAILFAIAIGAPTSHSYAASNVPSCVQSHAHARYLGFAWDHIVSIDNHCEQTAACTVTTNVNPDPIDVTVPAKESLGVLTYRANPSREFTYDLTCALR